jgi:HlyD family secretion protein
MKKYIKISAVVALVLAGFFILRACKESNKKVTVETVKLARGTISNTVTASGTLEAVTTVEVGTQVSGVIEQLFVDFNTEVKKGQILAKLDETPLVAQLEQSKASVDQAEAEVEYQKANYERYKVLAEKKLIAQSDYDLVVYNYHKAVASLKNAKSVYDKNRINLAYATIYSPIDGIILDRAVDEGQTVAASFNTPTLFTIANDLTQMRVEASVDEADIGQVKFGQRVEFSVDAYSNRKFEGSVTEIRLKPVTTSNVVTYTVIVGAPNPQKELMPGMTANITIFVNEKSNILIVPGKATRFTPDQKLLSAYFKSLGLPYKQNKGAALLPGARGGQATPASSAGQVSAGSEIMLWVKNGVELQPVKVKLGETDGVNFEMISGIREGDELIVSLAEEVTTPETTAATASRSPFMPQRPGSNRR